MISDKTQDIFEVVISGLLGFAREYQKAEVKMTPKNYIVDSLHSMAHALKAILCRIDLIPFVDV